jgi:hypothetical protein
VERVDALAGERGRLIGLHGPQSKPFASRSD